MFIPLYASQLPPPLNGGLKHGNETMARNIPTKSN